MSLTFLHAADLDLDAVVSGVGPTPPGITIALRDASLAAWDRLVQTAIERDVAMVVVAGGVARDRRLSPRARVALVDGLSRLTGAGIAVVVWDDGGSSDVAGGGWREEAAALTGVTIVGATPTEVIPIGPNGDDQVTLYVLGGDPADLADRVRGLRRTGASGFHFGLVRATIDTSPEGPDAGARVSTDDLLAAGLDYWAVGGDHHGRVVVDAPPVVISGTIQGRGFGASESGPKGAMLITADGPTAREVLSIALDTVRFATVVVDVTPLDRVADIGRALLAGLDGVEIEAGQVGIVRGILTGSGPVRDDLRRPGAIAGILTDLSRAGIARDRVIWWDSVIDRTMPDIDLEAVRDRGDLAAEVLRVGADLRRDPASLAAWVRSVAGGLGSFEGDPWSNGGSSDGIGGWDAPLAEAEAIAINELDRDGDA